MKKNNGGKILIYGVLILASITMLFPFFWMVSTALKSYGESIMVPPTILPSVLQYENFLEAWKILPFANLYLNTIGLIFWRVICALITSSMAGYAFGRIEFKGKNILFTIVLVQMMLPSQIFIVPQYLMVAKLGWLNSMKGMLFPGLVSAFGTFLMTQFFKSIPKDIEEAGILDGCNHFKIYYRLLLPLSKSSLVALAIFTSIFAYKELMWPMIVNISLEQMTLSAALASLKGQYDTDFPLLMASSFIAMIPMLVMYSIFQKQFIQGIAFTGTKG